MGQTPYLLQAERRAIVISWKEITERREESVMLRGYWKRWAWRVTG